MDAVVIGVLLLLVIGTFAWLELCSSLRET